MPNSARTMTMEVWSGTMSETDDHNRKMWLRATPAERMEALEYIRALNYGYSEEDQPRPEFQRLYQSCHQRRVDAVLDGVEVPIISLSDLRVSKQASGREKDMLDLKALPEAPSP